MGLFGPGDVSGLYDFPAREYNGLEGRWPSPDPAGLASVDPTDPQTWNRYAYVRNSPLEMIDPTGMGSCPPNEICITTIGLLSAPDNGLIAIPQSSDPEWCNPLYLVGCGWPSGAHPASPPCQYMLANPCGGGGAGSGGGSPSVTGKPQAPCTLSTGQRVSLGIQGALNAGIGAYKAFQGAILTAGGLGFAPETAGVSLVDAAGGAYLLSAGGGQAATGIFQLGRMFTGNGGPETTGEQYAAIASGPLSGIALLASGHNRSDAERAANFESIFTAGNGLINSPEASSLIDAGLTVLGMSNTGGCHQ